MSKNLIINKLSKCNAYEYTQNPKLLEDSISKISTSTKTQQSPSIFTLNPQFTFKATDLKQIIPPRPKAQQFFQNFNPANQVIYQKVILSKFKMLERSLQFQLLNLARQSENGQDSLMCRKLEFYQNQSPAFAKIPLIENLEVRQQIYKIPEYVKTQYNEVTYTEPLNEQNHQNHFMEYFQNVPYDSNKYRISREKIGPFKYQKNINYAQKRCQTQTNQAYSQNLFQQNKLTKFQSHLNQKDQFDDYHFVSRELRQNKREPLHEFNNYYMHRNSNLPKRDEENQKSIEKSIEKHRSILLSRRSGNSSRLSFFRKQRQHHLRKSLLEEQNGQNDSKRSIIYSNENKQNIKSNSKFVPSLAFKSKAAYKKLKNQYSERFLLGRRHLHEQMQSSKVTIPSKGSINCMSKETENRIMSIRKQLRDIYKVEEKDKCKLKIMRDQEIYDNNAKNSLRRVGSICKF